MCTPFVILDAGILLTWAVLDHLVYLLLHRIKVEGRRVLHRRIVDRRLRQLGDVLLDHDEAPELTGEKVIAITPGAGARAMLAQWPHGHGRTSDPPAK